MLSHQSESETDKVKLVGIGLINQHQLVAYRPATLDLCLK